MGSQIWVSQLLFTTYQVDRLRLVKMIPDLENKNYSAALLGISPSFDKAWSYSKAFAACLFPSIQVVPIKSAINGQIREYIGIYNNFLISSYVRNSAELHIRFSNLSTLFS